MWRNTVVIDFLDWLRQHNAGVGAHGRMTGFYGMDLYSLNTSVERVIGYLNSVDPEAARRAQDRYSCFEFTGNDPEAYGYASAYGVSEPCEDEVVEQLVEMQRRSAEVILMDGRVRETEAFVAEQNARLVKNAEEYYRSMFRGRVSSWNLRDLHMVETLNHLVDHLNLTWAADSRIVVWAHNSHLCDARATEMAQRGEWNVGQIVREQHGADACLIGFTTHTGTVTAASNWGDEAQRKTVNPSMANSWERLFHDVGIDRFWLDLHADKRVESLLREQRLERAIGVIYRPDTERWSHYFGARLSDQFDAVIHLDETTALRPLERFAEMPVGDAPETYPFGDDTPTPNED
jgi:erythromycin esterase-like protein